MVVCYARSCVEPSQRLGFGKFRGLVEDYDGRPVDTLAQREIQVLQRRVHRGVSADSLEDITNDARRRLVETAYRHGLDIGPGVQTAERVAGKHGLADAQWPGDDHVAGPVAPGRRLQGSCELGHGSFPMTAFAGCI